MHELRAAKGPKALSIIIGKMIVLVFTCAKAFRKKEQRGKGFMILLNVLGCKTSNKISIIKLDMKVHVAQLAVDKLSSLFIDKIHL